MIKSLFVLSLVVALSASSAFAGDGKGPGAGGQKPGDKGQPGQGQLTAVSLDQLKDYCINWEKNPIQRQPQNIKVTCTDVTNEYVATVPGSVELAGSRIVQAEVTSHKWAVAPSQLVLPTYIKPGSCLRFKEIQKTTRIEHALSCDQLTGMKGTLEDFCQDETEKGKIGNPKLTQVADTGRVVDTCAGIAYKDDNGKGAGK